MKILLIALVLFFQLADSAWSDGLKELAPDLKVLSAEFGRFPTDKGPRNLNGRDVVFQKTNKVKGVGFSYGWRIKLDTSRKSVDVYEVWDGKKTVPEQGRAYEVKDGYIYHDWDVVMGTRKGKHTVEVYVEKRPIKKFTYSVI